MLDWKKTENGVTAEAGGVTFDVLPFEENGVTMHGVWAYRSDLDPGLNPHLRAYTLLGAMLKAEWFAQENLSEGL